MSCRLLLVTLAALLLAGPLAACPFCGAQGQTLAGDVKEATLVLFGTLENANRDPGNEIGQGTTDLRIETIVKDHEIREGKKVITLPRFLPAGKGEKLLVFCNVFKGKVDPYRGIQVKGDASIVKYLQGALERKDKPIGERLRFAFDYLDNADVEVSMDAYKEFAVADYKDYRPMAKDLPAEKIARWLGDPETPAFRFGLYGSLLGHCGTAKHAELIKSLLDDKKRRLASGLDGLMAGYVMLDPKAGWASVGNVMKDPSQEFMKRYAALRAVRFLWTERPELVSQKDLVAGISQLLPQNDVADLAIEDLRKWNRWEVAGDVLKLYGQKSHDAPIIRRAILRYALSCEQSNGMPVAVDFVKKVRVKEPEFVKDAEDLLRFDAANAPKPKS